MPDWSLGHIVLIGDASMAVSLLAGQGALRRHVLGLPAGPPPADGPDISRPLARYHRSLASMVDHQQRVGRRVTAWVAPTTQWQITLHNLTLRAASLPGMTRLLAPLFSGARQSLPAILTATH